MRGDVRRALRVMILIGLLVGMLTASTVAKANHDSFDVNTTNDLVDVDPGDGLCSAADESCSLRAAVMEANAHPGADTISVPAGTYVLTLVGSSDGDSGEQAGDLDIHDDLTLSGAGRDTVFIDGNRGGIAVEDDRERVFDVGHGVAVVISGVTIQNGEWNGNGGGVKNHGTLTITASDIKSNKANAQGGGLYNHREDILTLDDVLVDNNVANNGGGIYNNSDGPEVVDSGALAFDPTPGLIVSNSDFTRNQALDDEGGGDGGAIFNDDQALITSSDIGRTEEGNTADRNGGGIYNGIDSTYSYEPAELQVVDSLVEDNEAGDHGGAVYNEGGLVSIAGTEVEENFADDGSGGAIYNGTYVGATAPTAIGDLAITNSTIDNNETDGSGGGIYNQGKAVITGTTSIENNDADDDGGGIYNGSLYESVDEEGELYRAELAMTGGSITFNQADNGGGIYSDGTMTLTGTSVDDNDAFNEGGGIYNSRFSYQDGDTLVHVPGELTMSGGTLNRNDAGIDTGGGLYNEGDATISGATIASNTTQGIRGGGGIFNGGGDGFELVGAHLTLTASVVSGNRSLSGLGGGISNAPGSTATVVDTRIVGNWAREDGGGLFNGGLLQLTRSEVSGNGFPPDIERSPTERGGGLANSFRLTPLGLTGAGGFQTQQFDSLVPTVFVSNSTISGNTAVTGGGGVYNDAGFIVHGESDVPFIPFVGLNHVTLTANMLTDGSGDGIYIEQGFAPTENGFEPADGIVGLRATIISGHAGSNCDGAEPTSEGLNLEDADECSLNAAGDLKNADPKLGSLAANGGPTLTHALLDGSQALDAAGGGQGCPSTDQRGTTRPQGPACDIGAYERLFQAPTPAPAPAPAPPPAPRPPAVTPPPPPAPTPRAPRAVRRCTVPNVKGKTLRAARGAIAKAGCRARVMGRRVSMSQPAGRVIGQTVRPGARVRRGTIVRLMLSRGAPRPVLPPFTG